MCAWHSCFFGGLVAVDGMAVGVSLVFPGVRRRGARLWPRKSEYGPSITRRNRSRKLVWRQVLDGEGVAKKCNVNGGRGRGRIRAPLLDIVVVSRWKCAT